MNFPENQRTGALAEMDVERLFTSWSWSVGKDRIDSGYDLYVEPEHSRFHGLRFLVQVKGTARQKKGAPTARVKKSNLRKYAANHTPVFIVRSGANGVLHWLHVQPWARVNLKRLKGDGETTVVMQKDQRLDAPESFHRYLESILQPVSERNGGLAEVARERAEFLSSLDPRLLVQVGLQNGAETYEIYARQEPASFGLRLKPTNEPENVSKLRDAIQYGLPATIEVESFRMTGSELFKAIGADAVHQGSVFIGSTSSDRGTVRLCPGDHFSMLAVELSLPGQLYRGSKGIAVTTDKNASLIEFQLRGDISVAHITLGLRGDRIAAAPIQEHVQLATVGEWAGEVLTQQSVLIELSFLGHRVPLHPLRDAIDAMRDPLYVLFVLGRLHQVARVLDSPLVVTEDFALKKDDISSLHLLHAILRGERKQIDLSPIELTLSASMARTLGGDKLFIATALEVVFSGQRLGIVPVAIDLDGFILEALDAPLKYRLSKGPDGRAVLYYNEGGETGACISQMPLPDDAAAP